VSQELAESVQLSQSALSRTVARLERDELVERAICMQDQRGMFGQLTDGGREGHAAAKVTQ
jgi:DNA-binding MarR family transcriptional regulator